MMFIVAEAHANQFGVFTGAYDDLGGAMIYTFDKFSNGMSYDEGGAAQTKQPTAYTVMYFFISVVLFLVLAQV